MTTTKRDVDAAITEARRFIDRAEKALAIEAKRTDYRRIDRGGDHDRYDYVPHWPDGLPDTAPITYTKEAGAMRRASLDLTRALADMRRRTP